MDTVLAAGLPAFEQTCLAVSDAMAHPAPSAKILIVTDVAGDAEMVKGVLRDAFDHVYFSTDADAAAADFVLRQPDVLVLAFNSLEKSERYYLSLYRFCEEVHRHPHRTVILCNKDEVKRASELCMKDIFDDYILFWPMTFDSPRLIMSVHNALRELSALNSGGPSAAEFAAQVRHLPEMQAKLAQQVAQGDRYVEDSSRAMEQAERKIGVALDGLSRRFIAGELTGAVEVKNADGLEKEIGRFKREEVGAHFHAAAASAQPLKQWAQEIGLESGLLLESARSLNAMVERIRPTVLIVDDDEFQHKLAGKLLAGGNFNLVFAGDGFKALSLLRKIRADVILMDVMMPNMDGIETTRHIKSVPQFAKIPVIMITGKSEGQVVIDSLKAGA
ncbi:MAG: response regulator, partial [Chitinophagaceae bacterium]